MGVRDGVIDAREKGNVLPVVFTVRCDETSGSVWFVVLETTLMVKLRRWRHFVDFVHGVPNN